MAQKSLAYSSGYDWFMSALALPLLARREYQVEQAAPGKVETHSGQPVFPTWPDTPYLARNPRERIQVDLARLHQSTFISSLK